MTDWASIIGLVYIGTLAVFGVIQAYQAKNKAEMKRIADDAVNRVIDFFVPDPSGQKIQNAVDVVTSQAVATVVPERSWKMTDAMKQWILAGESSVDRQSILQQIQQAEIEGKTVYTIFTSVGTYDIEYGLLKGSSKGAKVKVE